MPVHIGEKQQIRGLNWVSLFHSLGSKFLLQGDAASYEHVCMCVCAGPDTCMGHKSLPFVLVHGHHTLEPGFT